MPRHRADCRLWQTSKRSEINREPAYRAEAIANPLAWYVMRLNYTYKHVKIRSINDSLVARSFLKCSKQEGGGVLPPGSLKPRRLLIYLKLQSSKYFQDLMQTPPEAKLQGQTEALVVASCKNIFPGFCKIARISLQIVPGWAILEIGRHPKNQVIVMVDKEQGKRRTFEKIANMQLSGMPNEAIAKVMAVTPPAISQITKREDYLAVKEEIFEHSFQKQKEIADMWDDAEHKALTGIAANMKWNADPEFALKVAAVANKAQRRGSAQNGNQPLSADVGRVVNIQLSNIYVNQITNGAEGQPETIEHRSMQNRVEDRTTEKMSDNLSKKAVEKLFDVTDEPASALRGETKLAQGLNALLNGVVPQLAVG